MEAKLQDRRRASSRSTSPVVPLAGSSTDDRHGSSAKDPRLRSRLEGAFDPLDGGSNIVPKGGDEGALQHQDIRPNSSSRSHSMTDDHAYDDQQSTPLTQSSSSGHFETQATGPKSSQARQENIPLPPPRLGGRSGWIIVGFVFEICLLAIFETDLGSLRLEECYYLKLHGKGEKGGGNWVLSDWVGFVLAVVLLLFWFLGKLGALELSPMESLLYAL